MKQYIKTNRVLLVLLAAAVAVSVAVVAQRWRAEATNRTCDVILDYSELKLMAEQSDQDVDWWLGQFRDMGVTKVALTEESITSLAAEYPGSLTWVMLDELLSDPDEDWEAAYPAEFIRAINDYGYDRYDALLKTEGADMTAFVVDAVRQRIPGEDSVILDRGDSAFILLNGTADDVLYGSAPSYRSQYGDSFQGVKQIASSRSLQLSLGLAPDKVDQIRSNGLEIIPRTTTYEGSNGAAFAQAVLDGYAGYGITPAYIIVAGDALVGSDESPNPFLDYITDNGIPIGLIETYVQRENLKQGNIVDTVRDTGYNAVRIFTMWDYIQNRYAYYGYSGTEEIVNAVSRSVIERDIRAVYFKPIKETDDDYAYITDPAAYEELFSDLDRLLAVHNITRGDATVLPNFDVPLLARLVLGLGAAIGGVLLLPTFLPVKRKWTLLLALAGAVCVAGAWWIMPNTYRLLASFANAVVFACLATAFFLRAAKRCGETVDAKASPVRILPRAMGVLVLAVLIAFAGGMMTAAPLSSTPFMLGIGFFRGVKAAQLLPLAFFCLLFVSYYGLFEKDRRANTLQLKDIHTALRWTIPVWAILLGAVLAAVGYYYLARTGHETNVSISSVEMILRNTLDRMVLARPRTKEFLVAFPAIMLTVYCAVRRLPFWTALFGLAGTIGMTSVCNTFMHIYTPLYMGVFRTAGSLVLGLVLGTIFMFCFDLLLRVYDWVLKKFGELEQR